MLHHRWRELHLCPQERSPLRGVHAVERIAQHVLGTPQPPGQGVQGLLRSPVRGKVQMYMHVRGALWCVILTWHFGAAKHVTLARAGICMLFARDGRPRAAGDMSAIGKYPPGFGMGVNSGVGGEARSAPRMSLRPQHTVPAHGSPPDPPCLVPRVPESRKQSEKISSWCTSCWTRHSTTATLRAPARRPLRTTSATSRSWWTRSSRCGYRR